MIIFCKSYKIIDPFIAFLLGINSSIRVKIINIIYPSLPLNILLNYFNFMPLLVDTKDLKAEGLEVEVSP